MGQVGVVYGGQRRRQLERGSRMLVVGSGSYLQWQVVGWVCCLQSRWERLGPHEPGSGSHGGGLRFWVGSRDGGSGCDGIG